MLPGTSKRRWAPYCAAVQLITRLCTEAAAPNRSGRLVLHSIPWLLAFLAQLLQPLYPRCQALHSWSIACSRLTRCLFRLCPQVYLTHEAMKTYYGKESPAPNMYNLPGSMGPQPLSNKESLPLWKQGTSGRFQYDFIRRANEIPAVGTYNQVGAIGKQPLSIKRTGGTTKFGTGTRDATKKTFISKEHEKAAFGMNSPGPTTGNATTSLGKQTLSVKSSAPGWGFGTQQRIKDYGNNIPGPGSYYA